MSEIVIPPKIMCNHCGRMLEPDKFYPNYNKFHTYQKMFFCKDCCKTMAEEIFQLNSNYEVCTRNLCAIFNMPYYHDALVEFRNNVEKGIKDRQVNLVFKYLQALKETGCPEEYWNDLSSATYFGVDLLKTAKPTSDGDVDMLRSLERDWGKQDSIYDYLFLEEKFNGYTSGEVMTAPMINTVRYLCLAELDVKKLRDNGAEQKEITSAEKRVIDYYGKLKMDDFKFNKSKSAAELLIEEWARIEEAKEPLDWFDEKYDDVCKFREDLDDIYRSLGNRVVGLKDYPNLSADDIQGKKSKSKKAKDKDAN